jgi:CheY-like chemotaxis protein
MDGYKATCGIRKFDSKIPIVAISANAFAEDINKSLKVGMNDHLIKPINVENLKTIIFKYLS